MSEQELAAKFIAYFEGYEIFKEVPSEGIIDFVGVLGNVRVAVEVKLSFNWKVLEQAVRNLKYANYSYIAVPYGKDMHFREQLAAQFGVGVLYYRNKDGYEGISEKVEPKLQRKIMKLRLEDWMKRSPAGCATERMTAFKLTVENIYSFLRRTPNKQASVERVVQDVKHHYGSNTSAKQCIINMCRSGIIKEFTYQKGMLAITP